MKEAFSIPQFVDESLSRRLDVWHKLSGDYIDLDKERMSVGPNYDLADSLIDDLVNDLKSGGGQFLEDDRKAKSLFAALFNCEPDVILSNPFKRASIEFARAAKRFDSGLRNADIYQAIRNLWIANSIQYLFDKKIAATPPLFAYSMLYPYSDNLLDDPALSGAEKKEFNARFRARLKGGRITPSIPLEKKIFQLVELIEGFFERREYRMVYDSLMAIQEGQEKSAILSSAIPNSYETVCRITFEKGGTSVLADGCLVCGHLEKEQAEFLMGYGIFLQLIDDLQDIAEDSLHGQTTIFTISPDGWGDEEAARMIQFMFYVIDKANRTIPGKTGFFRMIENCCLTLAYRSIFNHMSCFTEGFLDCIEKTGFSREFYERQKRKLKELSQKDVARLLNRLLPGQDLSAESLNIDQIITH